MVSPRVTHEGGVPWWEAPTHGRRGRHRIQTHGAMSNGRAVSRCACGAFFERGVWFFLDKPRYRSPWWRRSTGNPPSVDRIDP